MLDAAKLIFPGGVNSPVRAMRQVGLEPLFVSSAKGPYLYDVQGREYVDFIGAWGPMILGHAHPAVVDAVCQQAQKGLSYGISSPLELELGELVQSFFPSMQMMRFVNSGTEATMSAIRLAKGITGRQKIIKFQGCYHGHVDALLVSAGSGLLTFSSPSSEGIDPDLAKKTLVAEYNDLNSVATLFAEHPNEIATIIVEPIAGNMNMILPEPGFLQGLRQLCDTNGALLIFDEVMSGFRVAPGGAQEIYQVEPDLMALGKVIGGGMPAAAYGGRKEYMEKISPLGSVYQAGTMSGNPLAMACGIATLNVLKSLDYQDLQKRTEQFLSAWQTIAKESGCPMSYCVKGGMFGFVLDANYPTNFSQVSQLSSSRFGNFYRKAFRAGLYFAPSLFEAGFLSFAHEDSVLDLCLERLAFLLQTDLE